MRRADVQRLFCYALAMLAGAAAVVLGSLKQLDLHALIAGPASRMRDLVVAMIVARVIDARSKLATARALNPESAVSTLGQALSLGTVDENELYDAMDWLVRRPWGIEQRLAWRHLSDNTLVLYNLTSGFFEGHTCPLAQCGHSRDGKRGTLQIVFGLQCTAAGCPVAVEVFEGSTSDPKTVAAQVDKIRRRFGLQRVVLVGDHGMLTGARIREDLQGVDAYKDLAKVERAFRSMKTVDLKVRPIYHRRADRVRAHVLLCILAY